MFGKKNKEKELLKKPRPHHYAFAHVFLRTFCEHDPLQAYAILASDKKDDLVKFIWEKVCEHCDEEQKTDLAAADIKISKVELGSYPTILVRMPEAKAVGEAIMIAIVLTSNLDSEASDKTKYRYFVLEQGSDLEGGLRTVLCEWTGGRHKNMGDGPDPEPEYFLREIESNL